ncbi:MAG TPA: HemK/PrmC family methyltransferase, partial [Chthonomonadaceae bacterium]|nr:HemK/PrmC family methyltransferase [Chthonomonadaceae bacterium]
GCIVIAALAHCATAQAVALDLSWEALTLARRNAETNGVSARVRFAQGDLLTGVKSAGFDVIVSNPPYIPTAEVPTLQSEVRDFEPRLALDGGADGLVLLRGLSSGAQRVLRPGGWLGVEVALGQAETVAALLHAAGWGAVETRRDLAGIARVVCGQKSGE